MILHSRKVKRSRYSFTSYSNAYLVVTCFDCCGSFKYNPTEMLVFVISICRELTSNNTITTRLDLTLALIASVKVHYHIHKLKPKNLACALYFHKLPTLLTCFHSAKIQELYVFVKRIKKLLG